MKAPLEKKYPRIFSLSTIGLIHHFNVDYIFHPFRTDFSGESGLGKTTIANLLQLIFVGSECFKAASNSSYKPSGYVLKTKESNIGYAFINIELSKQKYLILGIFLKAGRNHVEHFIIQNGYDWKNLEGFSNPINHRKLIYNDSIIDIPELKEIEGLFCKTFDIQTFQEILYENKILPIDLHKSIEKRRKYANILKSFSAGKNLQWNSSHKLQEFLFGTHEYKEILDNYRKEIISIQQKYDISDKNDIDIEQITKRADDIQELATFKTEKDKCVREYRVARNVFWFYEGKKLKEKLDTEEKQFKRIQLKAKLLDIKEQEVRLTLLKKQKSEIEEKQKELEEVNEKIEKYSDINFSQEKKKINEELRNVTPRYNNVDKIKELLVQYENKERIQSKFNLFIKKKQVEKFKKYLKSKSTKGINWINEFDNSNWSVNFQEGERQYKATIEELKNKIVELEALKAFSNYHKENSLIKWSVDKLQSETFTKIQESIIAHYYKLYLSKPQIQKRVKYIPKPETLLNSLKKNLIEEEKNGFWLNLNGIKEFIEYRDKYFLNSEGEDAKILIEQYAKKADIKIGEIENKITNLNTLQTYIIEYEDRSVFSFYENRDAILNLEENNIFTEIGNLDNFKSALKDYQDKVKIDRQYNYWNNEKDNIIANEKEFEGLEAKKEKLNKYMTENNLENIQEEIDNNIRESNILNDEISRLYENEQFQQIDENLTTLLNNEKNKIKRINELRLNNSKQQNEVDTEMKGLKENLEQANTKRLDAEIECKLYNEIILFAELKEKYKINPEQKEKKALDDADYEYNNHCSYLTKTYFSNDNDLKNTIDYKILVEKILPQIYAKSKFEEKEVVSTINEYLEKINKSAKEINSVFVQSLSKYFQEVYKVYERCKEKHSKINIFFSQNAARITGGHKVKLTFEDVPNFPIKFLTEVKRELNTEMSYIGGGKLFSSHKQKDIEKDVIELFKNYSQHQEVSMEDLLNPMNYFSMEFSMRSRQGKENKGSTGQRYAAIALLCIAQMSELNKTRRNQPPKGIRFMPIDDAQDLGSNYDMLYKMASTEDFQLITFSISPLDNLEIGNQNLYFLNENKKEEKINAPPFAILSSEEDTIYKWEKYLNNFYDE